MNDLSNLSTVSKRLTGCRSCGSADMSLFLDLGVTPLADRLVLKEELGRPEIVAPLQVALCNCCGLVQITDTVAPEILFSDRYDYYSSFSPALVEHSRRNVSELIASRGLTNDSLVMELASNDGYLLRHYVNAGVPVLGIDPVEGPAKEAAKHGVETLSAFFGLELAQALRAENKRCDVLHANNVLAHVADTNGFVAGIAEVLKEDGVAVIEAPYLKPLIDHLEFDTIYHQHLCYFSVSALDRLFRRHGLYLNDVRLLDIHGGSLRLYLEKTENVGENVLRQLALEEDVGLTRIAYFESFAEKIGGLRVRLTDMLSELKSGGARIAGYGAAAKATTLINYMGLGTDLIDFVVDRNKFKHGKYMPGHNIPIRPVEALLEDRPDYVLLLAWNFAEEILEQQSAYRSAGGKFIVPVPEPRLV
ncbi:MAG: class I SAM-dependent methyltransferase [Pseudomonadota bacterium]